MAAKSAANPI